MHEDVQRYIKSKMDEIGVDSADLSKAAGVPRWKLDVVLSGGFPVNLPPSYYLRIAKALNLDPYDLFVGSQERRIRDEVRRRDLSDVQKLTN